LITLLLPREAEPLPGPPEQIGDTTDDHHCHTPLLAPTCQTIKLEDGYAGQALLGQRDLDGDMVLVVSQSPDAPHVIGVRDRLGVPLRDGAWTEWMREREIDRLACSI
jgi:hypothetical protein